VSGTGSAAMLGCSEDNMRACHRTSAGQIAVRFAAATSISALIASRSIHRLRGTFAWLLFAAVVALGVGLATAGAPAPSGRAVMAWHVTIPPSWFDPSTAPPQITPFGMLYAIHDALVRPYPGYKMGPSLAESWEESEDGLFYEFKLRPGLKFHNGDPLTAEDVSSASSTTKARRPASCMTASCGSRSSIPWWCAFISSRPGPTS
jgi:hypothetical protein